MAGRKCPICSVLCKNTFSLKRHFNRAHPDSKEITTIPSSPKKLCDFCKKEFSDIRKHVKTCKSQPKKKVLLQKESSFDRMSNQEFVQYLKRYWMRPGSGMSGTTVKLYISKIKMIINFEIQSNKNFMCHWWLDPASPNFQTLKEADMYLPADGYGRSNIKQVNPYSRIIDYPLMITRMS